MAKKAVVLGCGLVGATMARDMAGDPSFNVTAVDVKKENLDRLRGVERLQTLQADLGDPRRIRELVADADIVLGAMPSVLGFQTLRTVIEAGKPYSDISFMPEDALDLDELAKSKGVTAVVDCGVSPGLSNLCVGHACKQLDEVESVVILVGGLPKVRKWPYEYKAPFAPSDVIEEYTRPARLVEKSQIVTRPALSEPELMDFPNVGTLEAFNTDGLRSLIRTMKIPNMKEKTLRFPGHIELMRAFRETGLFDKTEIEVKGVRVRPLDVTSRLLFPKWTYQPGEEEFTVLRVIAEGVKDGRAARVTFDLYDQFDKKTMTSSMARTTAFPATIVARMLCKGQLRKNGVTPPELLADSSGVFDEVIKQLANRGVSVSHHIEIALA